MDCPASPSSADAEGRLSASISATTQSKLPTLLQCDLCLANLQQKPAASPPRHTPASLPRVQIWHRHVQSQSPAPQSPYRHSIKARTQQQSSQSPRNPATAKQLWDKRRNALAPISSDHIRCIGGRLIERFGMQTPPFNFPFTVRSGTTRTRHPTMAEFISARFGS